MFNTELKAFEEGRRVNQETFNTISRTANGSIGFGRLAVSDGGRLIKVAGGAASGELVVGITEANQVNPLVEEWADKSTASVMTQGVIAVRVYEAVSAGETPTFHIANDDNKGLWGNSTGGSGNDIKISGAVYETGTDGAGLAAIRFDLTPGDKTAVAS